MTRQMDSWVYARTLVGQIAFPLAFGSHVPTCLSCTHQRLLGTEFELSVCCRVIFGGHGRCVRMG